MNWLEGHTLNGLKRSLPRIKGKDLVAFGIFLTISASFWFVSTLNDTYEMEIKVPLQMSEVPEHIVITEPLPDSVTFTVKDKGFILLQHQLEDKDRPIRLPFKLYKGKDGKGSISANEVQKIFATRFPSSTRIVSVKAKHWDFCFNHGAHKSIPVVIEANFSPKANYYISSVTVTPDTVSVFASTKALDTILSVKTEQIRMDNVSQSFSQEVELQRLYGSKMNPAKVKLNVICEQITEASFIVPITVINAPKNIVVKTFPARIEVRAAVGVKSSDQIKPELFSVVADYNELDGENKTKIPIRIVKTPKGILKATLKTQSVDYLLETQRE